MKASVNEEKTAEMSVPSNTFLFEIAWEVCNQVGGIYTVIRSKVPSVIEKWGKENYFLIGPYFEALHQVQNQHLEFKEKIHEFVMGHFFQSYSFDLDNTLYFFTSGRYEYHNKGYDLTLEALARLNWRIQHGY